MLSKKTHLIRKNSFFLSKTKMFKVNRKISHESPFIKETQGIWENLPYLRNTHVIWKKPPNLRNTHGIWENPPYQSNSHVICENPPYLRNTHGIWETRLIWETLRVSEETCLIRVTPTVFEKIIKERILTLSRLLINGTSNMAPAKRVGVRATSQQKDEGWWPWGPHSAQSKEL